MTTAQAPSTALAMACSCVSGQTWDEWMGGTSVGDMRLLSHLQDAGMSLHGLDINPHGDPGGLELAGQPGRRLFPLAGPAVANHDVVRGRRGGCFVGAARPPRRGRLHQPQFKKNAAGELGCLPAATSTLGATARIIISTAARITLCNGLESCQQLGAAQHFLLALVDKRQVIKGVQPVQQNPLGL